MKLTDDQFLDLTFPMGKQSPQNEATFEFVGPQGRPPSTQEATEHKVNAADCDTRGSIPVEEVTYKRIETSPEQDWAAIVKRLHHVDEVMQQFAAFWSNMEVLVDAMFQKSEHVEVRLSNLHDLRRHMKPDFNG